MHGFCAKRAALLLLWTVFENVHGRSDSAHYAAEWGMSNPNAKNKHYWADTTDLLDDLASFQALYVRHHNCAISAYDYGCGAEAEDEEYWYMEVAPCFRANAAFSVYGILQGEDDTGCNRRTYINSFMTSTGVEAFTTALEMSGFSFSNADNYNNKNNNGDDGYPGGVSATCSVVMEDEGADDGAMVNDYSTSYGVSCSSSGTYVAAFFRGAYCDSADEIGRLSELENFNKELNQASCVRIYTGSNNNNNYRKNRDLGGSGDGEDEDSPLSLLYNSHACSIDEFPDSCPDPFGKLGRYEKALKRSTGQKHNKKRERIRAALSWIMLLIGAGILSIPIFLARRRRLKRKQQRANTQTMMDDPNYIKDDEEEESKPGIKKKTLWQRFTHSFRRKKSGRASDRDSPTPSAI